MKQYLTNKQLNKYLIKTYKKEQILFHENDLCKNVCLLLEGNIEIKSYTNEGQEIVYNLISEDELFGHNLLFSNKPIYKGDVIASSDCKVMFFNKQEFLDILHTNPLFLNDYLEQQANKYKELNAKVKLLTISDARERFMYYLSKNNNAIKYDSITSLANNLYLTRETTSRLISKLVKDKVIIKSIDTIKKAV